VLHFRPFVGYLGFESLPRLFFLVLAGMVSCVVCSDSRTDKKVAFSSLILRNSAGDDQSARVAGAGCSFYRKILPDYFLGYPTDCASIIF